MSLYSKRGVSAQKEEVHAATGRLNPGLFPNAFCKVYPDFIGGDPSMVNLMHADGAGTKSILAYLYWKETGDISVWRGIAQDAIVMNLDDLLCVGIHDHIVFNSTIDRNKRLITGPVLTEIIEGSQAFFEKMAEWGVHIHYLGGETADVGDVVRTVAVNGTMTARWPKDKIVTNEKIQPGDVIIGLAGFGTCAYEPGYNSGIGSNGLTSARHDALDKQYAQTFPESFDPGLPEEVVYIGNRSLTDSITLQDGTHTDIGHLLLSPTRSFAPVLKPILMNHFEEVHGLIHCSGGGQTKCLKYLPGPMHIIKDQLFDAPEVFQIIQQNSQSSDRDMFEVFNMGTRMEIYCAPSSVQTMLDAASRAGIMARVIGRVEASPDKKLTIHHRGQEIIY